MAQRTLLYYGNPILREIAKKIHRFDASIPQLVQDMFETMRTHEGIGLAAPQIGLSLRVFVVECTDRETGKHFKVAMANPEIIKAEGEQRGVDACSSIPGYYGVNVRRAAHVVVKGQDLRGKPMRINAEGLFAGPCSTRSTISMASSISIVSTERRICVRSAQTIWQKKRRWSSNGQYRPTWLRTGGCRLD